jgi:hypothetical protein
MKKPENSPSLSASTGSQSEKNNNSSDDMKNRNISISSFQKSKSFSFLLDFWVYLVSPSFWVHSSRLLCFSSILIFSQITKKEENIRTVFEPQSINGTLGYQNLYGNNFEELRMFIS